MIFLARALAVDGPLERGIERGNRHLGTEHERIS
jgi:hypothetical protein